jgi:ketosteroid isomerase-like protein
MRRAAVAALALPAAQIAYEAAFKAILRRSANRFFDGDVDGYLRFYADDAELHFPGDNSWGPVYRGKDEIRGFLERFLSVGLGGDLHEIVVDGPPWNTTVFVRFTDYGRDAEGTVFYDNSAAIFLKVRWGKVVHEEVFEDTEKTAALDRYLERSDSSSAATRASSRSTRSPSVS